GPTRRIRGLVARRSSHHRGKSRRRKRRSREKVSDGPGDAWQMAMITSHRDTSSVGLALLLLTLSIPAPEPPAARNRLSLGAPMFSVMSQQSTAAKDCRPVRRAWIGALIGAGAAAPLASLGARRV